jgi:hypothetical protein
MDADAMERLLIDKRLGELPPDTEELLLAYLQLAPSAEAAVAEIDDVIRLASKAIQHGPLTRPHDLPPLSISEAVRREHPSRAEGFFGRIRPVAMVAALALAFLLGMRLSSVPSTPSLQISPPMAMNAKPAESADFWSVEKYVANRSGRPSKIGHVEWRSPLVWPQMGEKL